MKKYTLLSYSKTRSSNGCTSVCDFVNECHFQTSLLHQRFYLVFYLFSILLQLSIVIILSSKSTYEALKPEDISLS